jgi:polyhydroxyalkanoate synthase
MNQSKTSAETPAPVKDQTTSPRLGQPGAGAPTPKNSPGKSGGTPDGNLSLPGNGKAEDAFPDPAELSHQIAKRSRELVAEFLKRQAAKDGIGMANPLAIATAFLEMTARLMSDPSRLVQAQLSLRNDYLTLWLRTTQRFLGGATEPVIEAPAGDRRFRDVAWTDNALFDFIKQSYLLKARWLQNAVRDVEGIDAHTARKVDFYTRQFVDAIAPPTF